MHLFLHGFLGQKEDWDPVLSHFPSQLIGRAIDLPGHGREPLAGDIVLAVHDKIPSAKTLIGYSAGGRIALALKARFPDQYGSVIAISAHPGLYNLEERKERLKSDEALAKLLETAPFEEFLEKWYAQDLFKTLPLNIPLLERRKKGNPHLLAQFLRQFSLGRYPPPQLFPNTTFVCGNEDLKYVDLYRKLRQLALFGCPNNVSSCLCVSVENAGHALHIEKPEILAHIVMEVIGEHNRH